MTFSMRSILTTVLIPVLFAALALGLVVGINAVTPIADFGSLIIGILIAAVLVGFAIDN